MARADLKALPGAPRARRIRERLASFRKTERFWLAVAASLALSAVLTLDLFAGAFVPIGGRLPQEGEIADRSYKAPFDLSLLDRAATDELRRAAEQQSPAVYDFDERRAASVREELRAAFAAARGAKPVEGAPANPRAAFQAALGERVALKPSALDALARGRFSEEDERTLAALVGPVVARMIVDDVDALARTAEQRPVLVRELGSGTERRIQGAPAMLAVEAAREAVRRQGEPLVEDRPAAQQAALLEIAAALVRPNTSLNLRATDERRQAAVAGVKDVTATLRRGEIIVRDGDPVTAHHVRLLAGIAEQAGRSSQLPTFAGVAGVVLLLLLAVWRLGRGSIRAFPRETRDVVFMLSALVATALGTRLGLYLCDALVERPEIAPFLGTDATPLYFVLPIAASAMLVRMVQSAESAALFAALVALVAGFQVRGEVAYAAFVLVGSLSGALGAARVTQRGTLLRAGLRVGAANMAAIAALGLIGAHVEAGPVLFGMLLGGVGGVLAGVLVSGLAPAIETIFGYTTDVKLLELANREQAVLRDLELRAPGTYHHSMMVGHLAEKAAEAIGANALLAKVAGYYHDIGKMRRPHFFVENFPAYGGENRHEKLSPPMSARIIQAHVKDGLEIGRDHKLAQPILAGIAQHHGTSVIRFFYEKAKEQAQPEKGETIEEHEYRYSGPRPQTREAGILMLADSVEAASRTLADTSPARIQQLVQRVINNYFRDGQLDECSLTLRDLHAIARSFIETLSAIRHERIDYPEATDAEGRRLDEAGDEGVVERLEPRAKDRPDGAPKRRDDDLRRLGLP
jgi:hypothetical protein